MSSTAFRAAFFLALLCAAMVCDAADHQQTTVEHPALQNLSPRAQAAWRRYFERSNYWRDVDRRFIEAELVKSGRKEPAIPSYAQRFGFDPRQPVEWYAGEAGQRIADIIVSFQTPSGGWSKRTDMSLRERLPGEAFGVESGYIPTFDNDATTTQLRVLARAFNATNKKEYRAAFLKGLRLILEAQFPNGGWPQNFPLTGGYHDYITYNDETMVNLLALLQDVAQQKPGYAFVPTKLRRQAQAAVARGLDCVLKTQITVNGVKTVWAGQHDPYTLAPQSARAYEPVAQTSGESAALLAFLMTLPEPSSGIIEAVDAAVAWFEKVKITGYRWELNLGISSSLTADPDAGPLWARFYEIGTDRPVFGDRDGSVHHDVRAISRERQIRYAWYIDAPAGMLKRYVPWRQRYPAAKPE